MGILTARRAAKEARAAAEAKRNRDLYDRLAAIIEEHAPKFHDEYRIQWLSNVSGKVIDTFHKFRDVDAALDYIDVDYGGFLERNITWVETRRVPEWRPL